MLDKEILEQLRGYFAPLKKQHDIILQGTHGNSRFDEAKGMLEEISSTSPNINLVIKEDNEFLISLFADGEDTGIRFRGVPGGHEFTSFLLAVLNQEGIGKNLPDEGICRFIKNLKGPIRLQTYVSLECTNCPDVVQTLNVISMLNPNVQHEMVDGALYPEEVSRLGIASVPTVLANDEVIHVGRGDMASLLNKLQDRFGLQSSSEDNSPTLSKFDAIVVGAGPAGASSAIYLARKGLKVALVAQKIGGQVNETVGIENLISRTYITGPELASELQKHIESNELSVFSSRSVKEVVENEDGFKKVVTSSGEIFIAPIVIVTTGASWRKLNIPGEKEYTGAGVAYCAHCDGPFFKNKKVAVVGGGNSGIEAAIDLSNICEDVTVIEFLDTLKADDVLQKKAKSISNIKILTGVASKEIIGDGKKVKAIKIQNRKTEKEDIIELDGVFVQIGLSANSDSVKNLVETNKAGEIVIDERCRTNVEGIYAAGDCTTVPYKQIIIAMGEGAKAALTAFEQYLRG